MTTNISINTALDQLATEVYNYTLCRVNGNRCREDILFLAGMVRGIATTAGVTVETVCNCVEYDTDEMYFTKTRCCVSGSEFESHRERMLHHVLRWAE